MLAVQVAVVRSEDDERVRPGGIEHLAHHAVERDELFHPVQLEAGQVILLSPVALHRIVQIGPGRRGIERDVVIDLPVERPLAFW